MQETTNELFQGCTSSSAGVDYSIKYNRLESLETFPSSHVNPIQLAKYGFYYTGFEDNVICFSCQNSVRNWKQGDREGDNKWHKPNCAFFNSLSMRPGSSTTVNTISPIPNLNMSFLSESLSSSSQKSSISERNVLPPHSSPSLHSLNEAQLVDISTSTENMNVIHSPTQHSVATPIPQQPALNHFVNTNPSEFASYLQRLDLSQERDRRRSFDYWPSRLRTVDTAELARCGFYFTGIGDMVECFSCHNVIMNWRAGDDPQIRHMERFPFCRFIQSLSPQQNNAEPQQNQYSQHNLQTLYPCNYPHNINMKLLRHRQSTFHDFTPRRPLRASTQQIAEAGFYFMGNRDWVRCWYCGNKLYNFDTDDDPWVEHAKWFSDCEFLLQQKGLEFVERHRDQQNNQTLLNLPPSSIQSRPAYIPSPIPDHHQDDPARHRLLLEEGMQEEHVVPVIEIFGVEQVRRAMERLIESTGCYYQTTEGLINALLENEQVMGPPSVEGLPGVQGPPGVDMFTPSPPDSIWNRCYPDARIAETWNGITWDNNVISTITSDTNTMNELNSARKTIRHLQDRQNCKVCLSGEAAIVFQPCKHLCTCNHCALKLEKCPVCRANIACRLAVYRS